MISTLTTNEIGTMSLAVLFLLSAMLGSGKFRLGQMVRYYTLQSLCLAGLFLSLAMTGEPKFYWSMTGVLVFKVIVIPFLLTTSALRVATSGRLTSLIRPAPSYFVSGLMLLLAVWVGMSLAPALPMAEPVLLVTAWAGIFIGAAILALRRDLNSQIVGWLTIDNGLAILALASLGTLPWPLITCLWLATALCVVIMGTLTRRLKELYAVEDTGGLSALVD